jgi:orotate phosphoribosyltransferase/AMMECR1 domain-containing protein
MGESGKGDIREQLRKLLRDGAILYASPTQPIRHRNGQFAPWAFYSWNVTTTSPALQVIAANLLQRLSGFRSTQLASYGYTGIPILSACVMASEGRYSSLVIREQRKAYLSGRQVEGRLDRSRPVVVIDDSLSSGTSLHHAIRALEEEGVEVEGAIALVNFPGRGGLEWANLAGYRTECLFDIWTELEMSHGIPNSSHIQGADLVFSNTRIPSGLSPVEVARQTADHYLRSGLIPQLPEFLDREYDGRGGVFVSFRERTTDFRLARDGFWHFNPEDFNPGRDVVMATVEALQSAAGGVSLMQLPNLKIAVTFFSPLEKIRPAQLDFDQYGIVVQSRIPPHRRGGALPNTQVFISEIEQYRQARETNAQVGTYEPHDLFRHRLQKVVEAGEQWLPYGVAEDKDTSWWADEAIGTRLTARARALLGIEPALGGSEAIPQSLVPANVFGVAVNVYSNGLVGAGLAISDSLELGLKEAAEQVQREKRFQSFAGEIANGASRSVADVVVSVLHHPEWLGRSNMAAVARKLRRGLDSLHVRSGETSATFLPSLIPYNNWSRLEYVDALLQYSGIAIEQATWTTLQTAAWLSKNGEVFPLRFGFPHRQIENYDATRCRSDIRLLAGYIANSLQLDGMPAYYFSPVVSDLRRYGTAARGIHALMALGLAGIALDVDLWRAQARRGIQYCLSNVHEGNLFLPDHSGGPLAECVLLAAIAQCAPELRESPAARALANKVATLFCDDGTVRCGPKRLQIEHDHEFLPGAALWSTAEYRRGTQGEHTLSMWSSQLDWYRRRFACVPTWGAAGWQPQGWRAVWELTGDQRCCEFVFECADWGIDRQLEKNGAFLEDLSPDEPSFNTGFLAEGMAAAWSVASDRQDTVRAERYGRSWMRAMQFMTRLIIYPEDTFCMPEPQRAVGGVRTMQSRSDIRIDQVSHCLHALVDGLKQISRT